jgi:hypothetical protein
MSVFEAAVNRTGDSRPKGDGPPERGRHAFGIWSPSPDILVGIQTNTFEIATADRGSSASEFRPFVARLLKISVTAKLTP